MSESVNKAEWKERSDGSVEGWRGSVYLGVAIKGSSVDGWIVSPCGGYAELATGIDEAKSILERNR